MKSHQILVAALLGFGAAALLPAAKAHAQLSAYSCDALWHERNAIFARNGYCFKTDRAIAEFGRGCFPPYGRLTRGETERVREIKYWEREKGCAY